MTAKLKLLPANMMTPDLKEVVRPGMSVVLTKTRNSTDTTTKVACIKRIAGTLEAGAPLGPSTEQWRVSPAIRL